MKHLDVVTNPYADDIGAPPYFVVLQSDRVHLSTVVIAPLRPTNIALSIDRLHPLVSVDQRNYILMTSELAWVGRGQLGDVVGDVVQYRDRIIRALDFLFTGI
jgi:toxin CcdB